MSKFQMGKVLLAGLHLDSKIQVGIVRKLLTQRHLWNSREGKLFIQY